MTEGESSRWRLQQKLRELTLEQRDFGASEEIYYDLKLSGLDFIQLIAWVGEEFDVDFRAMDVGHYAPGEGAGLVKPILEFLGPRPYRSLRVGDLLRAIETKQWPPD